MQLFSRFGIRTSSLVLVLGLLLTAGQLIGLGLVLEREKHEAIQNARHELEGRSTLLAAHSQQILTAAKIVLESVAEDVRRANAQTPEEFRALLSGRDSFDRMLQRAQVVPQVDVATIVAVNGDILNFTRSYPPPPINLADRDYFKAHFNGDGLALYVSVPVKNRGNGAWTFYLSKAIRSAKGEIIGMVLTGIESRFFVDIFQSLTVDEAATAVSLFRQDGILLSRSPWREDAVAKSFAGQTAFRILASASPVRSEITRDFRLAEPGASFERIVAPSRVDGFPLVVNVTMATSPIIGDWWRHARGTMMIIAPAVVLSVLLTVIAAKLFRQREKMIVELTVAREKAEVASRVKSSFLANMSHEIRTPLNGILGMLQLVKRKPLDDDTKRFVTNADVSARHLLTVVNDILDLSKLEAEMMTVEPVNFSVQDFIHQVVMLVQMQVEVNGNRLDCDIEASVPDYVRADEARLRQILLNLVSNAAKFTRNGAIRISVSVRPSVGRSGDFMLRMEVVDSGIGIAQAARRTLFQDFSQADNSISRRFGGTGLGLSICRRLVRLMGGEIGFDSEEGKGSRFWFEVPCRAGLAVEALIDNASRVMPLQRSLRVLVAEDNQINQELICHLLSWGGHECVIAGNGIEALTALDRDHFDLVLMDIHMPQMDGMTAIRQIRAMGGPLSHIPIIVLTANAMVGDRETYLAAGADGYIAKPIEANDLFAAIAQVMGDEQPEPDASLQSLSAPEAPLSAAAEADMNRVLTELDRLARR